MCMCNCACRSTCFREGKSRGGAGNVTSVSFIYVWKHNKACQRNVRTCCASVKTVINIFFKAVVLELFNKVLEFRLQQFCH